MKHSPFLSSVSTSLLLGLLLCGGGLYGQADAAEQPGFLERFIAIFKLPPPETPAASDSLRPGSEPQDLTRQYWRTYNLIHQEQQAYYRNLADSSHTNWDELTGLPGSDFQLKGDTLVRAKNIKVFGWHPHWMGSAYAYYPFKLLSHVSLFSYNLAADSERLLDNPEVFDAWASDDFNLVELAHADNCKVLLTFSSFGRTKNRKFLRDPERQEDVITDLLEKMVALGADGIDLDFELVPLNFEKQLSAFIIRLRHKLNLLDGDYQLSVVLPKVNGTENGNSLYNVKLLQRYVDFFTLTAYDFTTGDFAAGPISPLYDDDPTPQGFSSIEDVVFNYLEDSLDRRKLLLGLPYYGGRWSRHVRVPDTGEDSLSFQHLTYAAISKANRRNGPPKYDRRAWAAYYRQSTLSQQEGFVRREDVTWFDDTLTMGVKYDWILEQGLGGVGIWALGYDLPQPELWGLIGEKFAAASDTFVYHRPTYSIWNVPQTLHKYSDLFGLSGLFVFAFLAIGFLVALFDWRVREVFFKNKTLRLLYIVASFALVTATLAVVLFLQSDLITDFGPGWLALLTLVIGLVSGTLLIRVISRWFDRRREGVP